MANPEHVIFGRESAWGTWVTPAKAFPVTNFKYSVGRERIDLRHSGLTRGLSRRYAGAKLVNGSLEMPLWSESIGMLLLAAQLTDYTASQGAGWTAAYRHAFLPDDANAAVAAASLSAQAQWSAAQAVNFVGVVIDKLTVSAKTKEPVMLAADWLARDEAPAGGVWDYDGQTASPAIIAAPSYFANTIPPFLFLGASLVTGGTPALDPTDKFFTLTGGTARTGLDNLEITLENGFDNPVFLGGPTPGVIVPQDRKVSGKFDVDLSTINPDFYTEYRAGSQVALQATFLGPVIESSVRREFTITLPLIDFDEAEWPDISASKDRKVRTVGFTGVVDPTSGYDVGVHLVDTQVNYTV